MTAAAFLCAVCGHAGPAERFDAREMMFGLRDPFRYDLCATCGSLQLADPPADMGRYYPAGYYSFDADLDAEFADAGKRALHARRVRALLRRPAPLARRVEHKDMRRPLWSLRRLRLRPDTRVLDLGCGAGRLLYQLRLAGYAGGVGFDPYLAADRTYANGLELRRAGLEAAGGGWDAVMLHHAFEHMAEPVEVLRLIRERLAPGGRVLLRLPLADGEAWARYGADWVQLDAPRHLHLHTRRGLAIAAAKAGLRITAIDDDSYELQFWGSEQYRRDLPLTSDLGWKAGHGRPIFTPEEIAGWRAESARLNRAGRGDQAAVHLVAA